MEIGQRALLASSGVNLAPKFCFNWPFKIVFGLLARAVEGKGPPLCKVMFFIRGSCDQEFLSGLILLFLLACYCPGSTMLQAGVSLVRVPMGSLGFFN